MKLNMTKKCSYDENDCVVAKEHLSEVITWLFNHSEKDYKKSGIKNSSTGEERICTVCREMGLLQEKQTAKHFIMTKAQRKAAQKDDYAERVGVNKNVEELELVQ